MRAWMLIALAGLVACGAEPPPSNPDSDAGVPDGPDVFADEVVSYSLGDNGGFGADKLPDVVLGPPRGKGDRAGSMHVLSLGRGGEIVLGFGDLELVDGDGPDLLVFENAFVGFIETGHVAVSDDGETWHEWPCDPEDGENGFPGCAGVSPVFASGFDGPDPADPAVAGGDAFDLADLGLSSAKYVRIRDSGHNDYEGTSGGFDLDAVALVHSRPVDR